MLYPSSKTTTLTYSDWNESIGRYCFNRRNTNQQVRFAIDPLVLQRAAAEGPRRYHFPNPEAAASDFCTVVTRQIDEYGWSLGVTEAGKIPPGLAKLALQVLAVFEIEANDDGGTSYWAALWRMLVGLDISRATNSRAWYAEGVPLNWRGGDPCVDASLAL